MSGGLDQQTARATAQLQPFVFPFISDWGNMSNQSLPLELLYLGGLKHSSCYFSGTLMDMVWNTVKTQKINTASAWIAIP